MDAAAEWLDGNATSGWVTTGSSSSTTNLVIWDAGWDNTYNGASLTPEAQQQQDDPLSWLDRRVSEVCALASA